MKNFKRVIGVLLAALIVFAMSATALAADTGSITITNGQNVTVEGKEFNAYKILDLKLVGKGFVYTVPENLKDFYATQFKIDKESKHFDTLVYDAIQAIPSEDLFAFGRLALKAAKDAGITPASAKGTEGADSVVIGNLPLGYYVVEDKGEATPISAVMLTTTSPNANITVKADKPTIEKFIDGEKDTDESTKGDVKTNSQAMGDTVPYKAISGVPDMTGYTKYYYVVYDTMCKGITFNNDVEVKIGDKTLVRGNDFTVELNGKDDNGNTKFSIIINNFIQYKNQKGDTILITYSGTINEDAIIGTAGNPNTIHLEYSNNPNVEEGGMPDNPNKPGPNAPMGITPDSTVRTYLTAIEIIKENVDHERLAGAEFKVTGKKLNTVVVVKEDFVEDANGEYYKLVNGTYTKTAPTSADDKHYDSTTVKYSLQTVKETIVKSENVEYVAEVGNDGIVRFEGVSSGTYVIEELKAPDGYNLLKEPVNVTISYTATSPLKDCVWSFTGAADVNGVAQTTIVNTAGSELPSTGGAGTIAFYVVGSLLLIGAVVLLITKRRMRAKEY